MMSSPRVREHVAEAAAEPLDPGEADAFHLAGIAVQDADPALLKHGLDLLRLARLEVVIAEDTDDRHAHRGVDLAGEALGLFGQAMIREVAAQQQHVALPGGLGEHLAHSRLRELGVVQVRDRSEADPAVLSWHLSLLPGRKAARDVPGNGLAAAGTSLAPCRRMIERSQGYPSEETLHEEALGFYRRSMKLLHDARVPFLVGGAYAFARYTGIVRDTKDFDIFLHRGTSIAPSPRLRAPAIRSTPVPALAGQGVPGGALRGPDLQLRQRRRPGGRRMVRAQRRGRGARHPRPSRPAEEMIWSKATIMERERFDGADVAHLLRCRADDLDWRRLLDRFGDEHARVLLAHLILFGYIYEDDADRIPTVVLDRLLGRVRAGAPARKPVSPLCRGTILSRSQYLVDVEQWGYRDARLIPNGAMSAEEIALWTAAAREEERQRRTVGAGAL